MTNLKLAYHYGNEAEQYSFYRIPKILFTDERYKNLSIDAKMLYGLMLDRMGLSIKNGWLDTDRKVFIYFTLEDACNYMGQSQSKMVRVMAELDCKKGIGLIERKKQGQGKPTIIYVKNCGSLPLNTQSLPKAEVKKYSNPCFKEVLQTCSNENSEPNSRPFLGGKSVEIIENIRGIPHLLSEPEVQTCENENSSLFKKQSQDCSNWQTNNTKRNNTELNDTQSIYPSVSPFVENETKKDGLMDRISKEELEGLVLEDLYNQKTLPYEYVADERKMTIAIHTLTGYEFMEESAKRNGGGDFYFTVFKLFNEALIEMLTSKNPMMLKGVYVTYAKVYDKFLPYLSFSTPYGNIYNLQETAISDFTQACKEQTIKNHLAYMKSCIWNAMQVGDIGIQALIKRDIG